jgi:hypothetical protein
MKEIRSPLITTGAKRVACLMRTKMHDATWPTKLCSYCYSGTWLVYHAGCDFKTELGGPLLLYQGLHVFLSFILILWWIF